MQPIFYSLLFCFLLIFTHLNANKSDSWAQQKLQSMSIDEKIGQLFMIAAYVDPDYAAREVGNPHIIQDIDDYIVQYHVGGLAYVGPSEIVKQVSLTNHYQEISKYPLLIGQDLEWGLAMRIQDGMNFPKNITLGAIQDHTLIYKMGFEIGRQAKLIGVHMNFSPVLDVNIEPENIAINIRSFGDSPQEVAKRGNAMICGLQDAGVIASAKHFPGLGDITTDPHLGLPSHSHTKKRLQEVELYPFEQAIQAGVLSIQTEHLLVPSLEIKMPASLSQNVISGVLKNELGFRGLILSGALRMKALVDHFSNDDITLNAFLAGSDMLLMPQDLPKAYKTLQLALKEGKITEKEIDDRVLKILQHKELVQLDRQRIVPIPSMEQLYTPNGQALKALLYQNAVKLFRNDYKIIPLLPTNDRIAYVQIGDSISPNYFELLNRQLKLDSFILPLEHDNEIEQQALLAQLEPYSSIILAIYPADPRRIEQIRLLGEKKRIEELKQFRVHGLPESLIRLTSKLHYYDKKIILTFFGNPFGLHFFKDYSTLIMAYESDPDAQQAAAFLLTGISNNK